MQARGGPASRAAHRFMGRLLRHAAHCLGVLVALHTFQAGRVAAAAEIAEVSELTEVQASPPTAVALTVYRDDLALVTETRTVDIPEGTHARVRFDGVMDRLIPTSAVLVGLGQEGERNFDYDGLTPRSLLWRSIGTAVTVTRGPAGRGAHGAGSSLTRSSERAIVQSAGDGIVLAHLDKTGGDRFEALGCSGLPERITFDQIPPGLRAKPSLSTTLTQAPAGTHSITLSYLVTGMAWQTDYTLVLEPDQQHASLSAWLSIKNAGSQGLSDAAVGVVAGDLSRVWDAQTREAVQQAAARACWPMGTTTDFPIRYKGSQDFAVPLSAPPRPMMARAAGVEEMVVADAAVAEREALQDYQLYRLPFATDVIAEQSKQVMLLSGRRVAIERLYSFRADMPDDDDVDNKLAPTTVLLRSHNDGAHGLGEPLPGGEVAVFTPHPEFGPLLTDRGASIDTPNAVDWRVPLGDTTAVSVQTKQRESRISKHWFDEGLTLHATLEHTLTNSTGSAQTLEFTQTNQSRRSPADGANISTPRISSSSDSWKMQDGYPTWRIVLAAHSQHILSYRVAIDAGPTADASAAVTAPHTQPKDGPFAVR